MRAVSLRRGEQHHRRRGHAGAWAGTHDVGGAERGKALTKCVMAIIEVEDLWLCALVWNGVPSICLLIRIW